MNSLVISVLAAIILCFHSSASAQTVFMCQDEESIGWHFENGRWNKTNFNGRKFFLRLNTDGVLDTSVASRVFMPDGDYGSVYTCQNYKNIDRPHQHFCNHSGDTLVFNSLTGTGAYSVIEGSISDRIKRDSISVTRISCRRM